MSENMSLGEALNPFDLLGVTIESSESDARLAFRELALLAHPDKGGRAEEMRVLMHAYRYVVQQLAAVNRSTTVEDLERGFAIFCAEQKSDAEIRPAWLKELLDLSPGNEFDELFDRQWRDAHAHSDADALNAEVPWPAPSMSSGYGAMMAPSEYAALEGVPVKPVAYRASWESKNHATSAAAAAAASYTEFRRDVVAYSAPIGAESHKPSCTLGSSDYAAAFNLTPEVLPFAAAAYDVAVEVLLQARLAERGEN
jgi:hypothetical protein